MLGKGSMYAKNCFEGNYIGADMGLAHLDLSGRLHDTWKEFNHEFIPIYLKLFPDRPKVTAGLHCATLWMVAKGMRVGDVVLAPDGDGSYYIGEITGDYYYVSGEVLPHRRRIAWKTSVRRSDLSIDLQHSTGAIGTYSTVTKFADEIEHLLQGEHLPVLISRDDTIEDTGEFALEKHLEDFLVQNWSQTELGKQYDIYTTDGEIVGQQYETDTGPIDILAVSKNKKVLLVVELKKGRVGDVVVGQLQRYMGYVKEELADKGQEVRGVIIALEDDIKLRRALAVTQNIEFYRYEVKFKLHKGFSAK